AEAIAVAMWLLPASVHIVAWPASGPVRAALFAPAARLIWFATIAIVAGAVLAAWSARRQTIDQVGAAAAPWLLLTLWVVPYLPWLPDRLPLLLVLAGPLRWTIVVFAAAASVSSQFTVRWRSNPSRRAVFICSLLVYLVFGLRSARALGPGGDEPHYLIITQSLLADGDLQIENNHRERQYAPFFAGELRPDYMRRGANGQIYSIHAPGLPALLLPAYVVGGYLGTVVFMCVISALTALAIFDLAAAIAGAHAALLTWIGVCLTIPFVPHGWLLFPEMPGALVVAWTMLWLWQAVDRRLWVWIARGIVLGLLPWLHTKFIVFTGILAMALLVRLWQQRKDHASVLKLATLFAAPIAVSLAAWLYSFYVIYGVFDPQAPYGAYTSVNVLVRNIPRGLLGLLVDQKFGIVFYSPIYLFAGAGAWIALKRRDLWLLGAALGVTTAAFVIGTTRLYMWWGGNSAPARFLVPVLPCLAPLIAVAISRCTSIFARSLLWTCLATSLATTIAGLWTPAGFYSDPHGYARLLLAVQAGSPLARMFPTFTNPDWVQAVRVSLPWLGAAVAALAVSIAVARSRRATPLWTATWTCVAFLAASAVLTARTPPDVRDETAARGAMDLLWQYDPTMLRGFAYDALRKADPPRLLQLATVKTRAQTDSAGPFSLPAGAYQARVWLTGSLAADADVLVSSPHDAVFGRADVAAQNPVVVPFELPVDVPAVLVAARRTGASIAQVEIAPIALVPASARVPTRVRAIESVDGRRGGYIVYADDNAYPERGVFWTRASAGADTLVVPGDYRRIVLTLSLGPLSGRVRLIVDGADKSEDVSANASVRVAFDVPSGARAVPITVQSPGWFRPSESDPSSSDTRRLGCQVRIDLE
ncbi:MAG TPA: hypothetical protein VIW45_17195, partial [Vicinamibacterales bacterium]